MIGLLKTLMRPDQEEDPERTLVARAANVLQVGEFQLLQLAYYDWHGHDLPESLTHQLFQAYMLHGEVPAWARHYARRILDEAGRGRCDDGDPSYHRYDHNYVTEVPRGARQFCLVSMVLAMLLVGGLLVSHVAHVEVTSMLPPYFERGELERGR